MKLSELVGKRAIRTAPITVQRYESTGYAFTAGGHYVDMPDYSYCEEPVKVLAATDTNAIVLMKKFFDDGYERKNLSCQFCDDNWADYDALESTITDESEELGNE